MGNKEKVSKTARKSSKKAPVEVAAKRPTMLTGSADTVIHRVRSNVTSRASCGALMSGWWYGSDDDPTCALCISMWGAGVGLPE